MNAEQFYPYFLQCNKVTIDSRHIAPNDIFFAFSGENFNAATLAVAAREAGALAVIVEQKAYEDLANHIFYTPSTLLFLQDLALLHRKKTDIPVIALTGSNGKTTTKELINAVLSQKFNVQCTTGNLNNHIGVPLTLLSVRKEHEIAVVEMGANHQKEIEHLCALALPDYGYVTNFGKAHLEGFGGFEGVIAGKSELYQHLMAYKKTIFINQSDPVQAEKTSGYVPLVTFGTAASDYHFEAVNTDHFVGLTYEGMTAMSQLTGSYNFSNLSAAAAIGLHFGVGFNQIKTAIESYKPTNMRSQVVVKNGITLVLDTYNANPSSMSESLKNFSTFGGSKTVIMGDMLELGPESEKEHVAILDLAEHMNFNTVITVGKHFKATGKSVLAFDDVMQLRDFLSEHPLQSQNILLKASRGIALERILDVFQS